MENFFRRLFSNGLPTLARLAEKGIDLMQNRSLCDHHIEDIGHPFFDCPYVQELMSNYNGNIGRAVNEMDTTGKGLREPVGELDAKLEKKIWLTLR